MSERQVVWKALANFASARREAKKTEQSLESLQRRQRQINAESTAQAARTAASSRTAAAGLKEQADASDRAAGATGRHLTAQQRQVVAMRESERAARGATSANQAASSAADALAQARNREAGASRAVAIAEARLAEARARNDDASTAVLVAEDRLIRVRERHVASQTALTRATDDYNRSLSDTGVHARSSDAFLGNFRKTVRGIAPEMGTAVAAGRSLRLVLIGLAVPTIVGAIVNLGSAISALTAGAVGLVGALAPAVGILGTLPGLLAGLGGGIATVLLGFNGIGGALKAYGQQQKKATKAAQQQTKAAQQQAKAEQAAARTAENNADAIASAERNVSDAHERVRDAQLGVTAARRAAQVEIDRMQKSLKDLALTEEGASLSLEEARLRLSQVNNDPGSTDLERRQASLAVREAEARLNDVRDQQKETAAAVKDAQKKGIDGSDQVVSAKKQEAQANRSLADAEKNLADTRRKSVESQQAADLAATTAATAAAADATDLYADAMRTLTPEAQAVVRQLISMKPLLDQIRATAQRGLMPGVLSFLQDVVKLFPLVNTFVGRGARSFGDFFARVGDGLTSTSGMNGLELLFESTNRVMDDSLDIAYNLGATIGNIAVAARPLTEWLVRGIRNWTRFWKTATSGRDGQRRLTRFFDSTRRTLSLLGRIIGNLSKTLYNIGRGTADLGRWMLTSFEQMTAGWAKWTGSVEGQNALADWADRSKESLALISDVLGELITGLVELGSKVDLSALLVQIRDQLLPALLRLIGAFSDPAFLTAVVSLASNLADLISVFSENEGGLTAFITTMDQIVKAVGWLAHNVPGATSVIGALIAAMAVRKAASLAGSLLGIKGAVETVKTAKSGISTIREAAQARAARKSETMVQPKRAAAGAPIPNTAAPRRAVPKAAAKVGTEAVEKAPGVIGKVAGVANKAGPALLSFGAIFLRILPWIGRAVMAIPGIGWAIGLIVLALSIAIPLIIKHWDSIKGAFQKAIDFITPYVQSAFTWIGNFIAGVVGWLAGVWAGIVRIFGPPLMLAVRIISFAINLIWAIIKLVFSLILTFLKITWGLFTAFVIRPVQLVFRLLGLLLSALGGLIKKAFFGFLDLIGRIWGGFTKYVIEPVRAAFTWVRAKLGEFGGWLLRQFQLTVEGLRKIWAAIRQHIIDPIAKALQPVKQKLQEIWNGIKDKVQPLLDWVKNQFLKVVGFLSGPFNTAKAKIGEFLGLITGAIKGWIDKVGKTLEGIKDAFGKAFAAIRKVVSDPIDFVVNQIINPGLIDPYNKLAKKLDINEVDRIVWSPPKFQEGGRIPGGKQASRDNVLGVSSKGVATARVEPGEWIAPRWMSPIFGQLEGIRRAGRGALQGFRDGGGIPADQRRRRRIYDDGDNLPAFADGGLFRPVAGSISQGIHGSPPAVDVATSVGHPVVAGESGRVSASKDIVGRETRVPSGGLGYRSYGRYVTVDHGGGRSTLYAHLSQRGVRVGQALRGGQLLGKSGNTGNSYGPHLHFGSQGRSPMAFFGKSFRSMGGTISDTADGDPTLDVGQSLWDRLNPLNVLKGALGKLMGGLDTFKGNMFTDLVKAVPQRLLSGLFGFLDRNAGAAKDAPIIPFNTDNTTFDALKLGNGKGPVLSGGFGSVARAAATLVGRKFGFGQIGTYPGHDVSEAASADFMVKSMSQGLAAATELAQNWQKYRVDYLIWNRKIWNPPGGARGGVESGYKPWSSWRAYSGTSNPHTDHVHATFYAKGTNSAKQGPAIVGENGPELVYMRGGERVVNNNLTRRQLPGYHSGGVVRGMKPGARGPWVKMLNSAMFNGLGDFWNSTLTRLLQGSNGAPSRAFSSSSSIGKKVWDYLWRTQRGKNFPDSLPWLAGRVGYDPTRLWRDSNRVLGYISERRRTQKNATQRAQTLGIWRQVNAARTNFGRERAGWIKSLEGQVRLPQDGRWDNTLSAAVGHAIDHGLGYKVGTHGHGTYDQRPWDGAVNNVIQEQARSNALNREFDGYQKTFNSWGLTYLVRKFEELGPSEGLTSMRNFSKNRGAATDYNALLKEQYDRADAASGGNGNKNAQIALLIKAVNDGTSTNPVSLQAAASKVSLSIDSTAALYDQIKNSADWRNIAANKRSRFEGDVGRFKNLFRFATGGMVPGQGNGDRVHILAEPGELMVRRAATAALVRDYGPEVVGMINNYDRFANGGFVAQGIGMPNFTPAQVRSRASLSKSSTSTSAATVNNYFNTTVNNPVNEPASVSVQRRVRRVARLGLINAGVAPTDMR